MRYLAALAALLLAGAPLARAADAPADPDRAAFLAHCRFCHLKMGTGTMMLARRLGEKKSLLADRTDLAPDYIRQVVRNGVGSMPPQTRVEVPDADLARIVAFLTRNNPPAGDGR